MSRIPRKVNLTAIGRFGGYPPGGVSKVQIWRNRGGGPRFEQGGRPCDLGQLVTLAKAKCFPGVSPLRDAGPKSLSKYSILLATPEGLEPSTC